MQLLKVMQMKYIFQLYKSVQQNLLNENENMDLSTLTSFGFCIHIKVSIFEFSNASNFRY